MQNSMEPAPFLKKNIALAYVAGILLMVFGMYGRVGSALPHDNPYWRARHPDLAQERDPHREIREDWPPSPPPSSQDQVR